MKLAEGMYVRTKYGYLARITEVNDNSIYCDNAITRDWGEEFYLLYSDQFKEIVKASHNIIDLIEVGDYVNGFQIIEVPYMENGKTIYKLHCGNNLLICNENYEIKSIVTREQFEAMQYKVVEEC